MPRIKKAYWHSESKKSDEKKINVLTRQLPTDPLLHVVQDKEGNMRKF
jgi:hypothetical protein